MPYYIYRITEAPIRIVSKVEEHAAFRTARERAKILRAELSPDDPGAIKMIFAETELHAEDLLSQVRETPQGPGDD